MGATLKLTSLWSPPLGETIHGHLITDLEDGCLGLGWVADAGLFLCQANTGFELVRASKATIRLLFELIPRPRELGTVPMLDIRAYAAHPIGPLSYTHRGLGAIALSSNPAEHSRAP
jgi:hypothetical protein